jgi:hypothetical protein
MGSYEGLEMVAVCGVDRGDVLRDEMFLLREWIPDLVESVAAHGFEASDPFMVAAIQTLEDFAQTVVATCPLVVLRHALFVRPGVVVTFWWFRYGLDWNAMLPAEIIG